MIIVKLWGGLGNQMFQYAFGRSLAIRNNDRLFFDTQFYRDQPSFTGKRQVEIERFFKLDSFSTMDRPQSLNLLENRYVNYVIRHLPDFHIEMRDQVFFVKEWQRHYSGDLPYKAGKVNYYDGYWLSEKYFEAVKGIIRAEYCPKNEIKSEMTRMNAIINREQGVGVHIRRGDYTKKVNLPKGYNEKKLMSYYCRAIDYIRDRVKKPVFYFFSDDIEWCKNTFGESADNVFLTRESVWGAIVDLFGIAACKHGIMSPSTFGWWGNWLREQQEGSIVVLPAGCYANTQFAVDGWVAI